MSHFIGTTGLLIVAGAFAIAAIWWRLRHADRYLAPPYTFTACDECEEVTVHERRGRTLVCVRCE